MAWDPPFLRRLIRERRMDESLNRHLSDSLNRILVIKVTSSFLTLQLIDQLIRKRDVTQVSSMNVHVFLRSNFSKLHEYQCRNQVRNENIRVHHNFIYLCSTKDGINDPLNRKKKKIHVTTRFYLPLIIRDSKVPFAKEPRSRKFAKPTRSRVPATLERARRYRSRDKSRS